MLVYDNMVVQTDTNKNNKRLKPKLIKRTKKRRKYKRKSLSSRKRIKGGDKSLQPYDNNNVKHAIFYPFFTRENDKK